MAKRLGADAALVVTPYYNKTTQRGLVEYFSHLAKIGIPIIMYNVPSRTGLNIEIKTVKTLIKNDMIYGIKESTSDINRIIELARVCRNKVALYSGEDSLNYIFYVLGASGTISVTANILTREVKKVFDFVQDRNIKEALRLQTSLSEINKLLFLETNPIPIKCALSNMGLISNEIRMPLVKISEKNERKIVGYLKKKHLM